ncbi:MAG: 3-ketoacyl-ACP reductase [Gammaproteobacteria bacterium]|nr:3-ketoacyl-ACP reductase [Gammaproteobacteria bacterium]|tara:strand:+ start:191 stop:949 length:759 start_codon:yes stop_codon:yes gene_type:complete
MDLQLQGRRALITGATKGIGRAIAESFASEGANVAICARNQEELDAAVAELESKGITACGQAVDVNDGDALKGFVDAAAEALGGLDCIVSNVTGGGGQGDEAWRAKFEGDVLGTVRLVEAALPHLEKSDNASIVMISTTAALEKFMNAGPYNAMKAALIQYSGALSQDVAPKGIRVNTISPGPIFIDGGAWDNIKQNMTPFYDSTLADIPIGRMGKAEEIADQVVFLASPRGAFTTGTNIVIDGGLTKRIQF